MHWTIIGGGIQGTTIALKLRQAGLDAKDLTIIDPYRTLCEQFNSYTHRISMPFKITFCTPYTPKTISF